MNLPFDRTELRKVLRQRRSALNFAQQQRAAFQLAKRIKCQPLFVRSKHIAFYLPNDGEIDPGLLLDAALRMGKQCYLPVLAQGLSQAGHLWFMPFNKNTVLTCNRFGIPEPAIDHRKKIKPEQLDLVLMPLVGFDADGGRMGMGGGFYDRTFAFKKNIPAHKTWLLGLAHSCQQVEQLPIEPWDVPMDAAVTECQVVYKKTKNMSRNFL